MTSTPPISCAQMKPGTDAGELLGERFDRAPNVLPGRLLELDCHPAADRKA